MDGCTLSGVAVRRLAAAGVVADARATLQRDDATARRLSVGPTGGGADGPSRRYTRSRANDHHRRGLAIQNASRDRFHRIARRVGYRRAPRREHDYAAARQEPLSVAVPLAVSKTQRSGHGTAARAGVE